MEHPNTVFISGPMSGYPRLNFAAFDEAEAYFDGIGMSVYNPAHLIRAMNLEAKYASGPISDEEYGVFMGHIVAVIRCATYIAVLPGWECSKGARFEVMVAQQCKLRTLDALTGEPVVLPEVLTLILTAQDTP